MDIIRKTIAQSINLSPPNLIETSIRSYNLFLQTDKTPENREKTGLQNVLSTIFPIQLCGGAAVLDFTAYTIDKPVYDIDDCKKFRLTYSGVLKISFRLILKSPVSDIIEDIKEQELTFGNLPLMSDDGTFIVNGIERVVLHQIHRAPGVYFKYEKETSEDNTPPQPTAKIIPYHGSYLNFAFNKKGSLCVQIDKKPAVPVTAGQLGLLVVYAACKTEGLPARVCIKYHLAEFVVVEFLNNCACGCVNYKSWASEVVGYNAIRYIIFYDVVRHVYFGGVDEP